MGATSVRIRRGHLRVRPDAVVVETSPLASLRGTVAWLRGETSSWRHLSQTVGHGFVVFTLVDFVGTLLGTAAGASRPLSLETAHAALESTGVVTPVLALVLVAILGYRSIVGRSVPIADVRQVTVDEDDRTLALTHPRRVALPVGDGETETTLHVLNGDGVKRASEALRIRGVAVEDDESD